MKKFLLLSCLTGFSFTAHAATLNIPADTPSQKEITLSPQLKATLSYNNGQFNISVPSVPPQVVTSIVPSEAWNNSTQVIVDDFNFDGINDLAIAKSVGYGGVNVFYDLYLFDNASKNFIPSLTEAANPEIRKDLREVRIGYKSGQEYATNIYRSLDGKLILIINTNTMVGSGLLKIFLHDTTGKVIKQYVASSVEEISEKLPPLQLKIKSPKAYFYEKPSAEAKTASYVIAGDTVTIMDVTGASWEWVLAEFKGPKATTQKWLPYKDLAIGEE